MTPKILLHNRQFGNGRHKSFLLTNINFVMSVFFCKFGFRW